MADVDEHFEPARVSDARYGMDGMARAHLILAAAASLFRRNGYRKTTMTELGVAAGIRGPSIYYHFKTKEDILYGICCESLHRLTQQVTAARDEVQGSLNRLNAMVDRHVVDMLENGDMHATAFLEVRWLSDDRREDVAARRDAYEAIFYEAVAAARGDGELRRDLSARELTLALLGLLNWSVFWYRPEGILTPRDTASMLNTVFFSGSLPRH